MSERELLMNAMLLRSEMLRTLLDPAHRDVDKECGYPDTIDIADYRRMFDREGIGTRVVNCLPEETWAVDPEVYETEDSKETEFEQEWRKLQTSLNVWHYLQRVDKLSGIGRYGVLLLGLDDGAELREPVEGIDPLTGVGNGKQSHKLLYLRAFDESVAQISQRETDERSPRFGLPKLYNLIFQDDEGGQYTRTVHWTRVIHVADERMASEVFGTPRMKNVWNRLLDIRKILSGSAEMYWKGAFPGISFEVDPRLLEQGVEIDKAAIRAEMENYMNGLQRYMASTGVSAKTLSPQVVDPTGHIEGHLKAIAIAKSIPFRILFGSEQAQLASAQDAKNWVKRINNRQTKYVAPMIIRPFVDRLMNLGCIPFVEEYMTDWPDLASPSDAEKADVAVKRTQALATYVQGGVDMLVPPRPFFVQVLDMTTSEAEAMMEEAEEYNSERRLESEAIAADEADEAVENTDREGITGKFKSFRETSPVKTRQLVGEELVKWQTDPEVIGHVAATGEEGLYLGLHANGTELLKTTYNVDGRTLIIEYTFDPSTNETSVQTISMKG